MHIICALCKARHLAARSAMNSLFRSAVVTIATSIGTAMKQLGGGMLISIRSLRPGHSGSKATRSRWVRRNQGPVHDRSPTRNCRHHHIGKGPFGHGRTPASIVRIAIVKRLRPGDYSPLHPLADLAPTTQFASAEPRHVEALQFHPYHEPRHIRAEFM
jgi:hypothetical protein